VSKFDAVPFSGNGKNHIMPSELRRVDEEIRRAGYAFVPGSAMAAGLQVIGLGENWKTFAASWDDLGFDQYMADGGRYRRRRFAAFCVGPDGFSRKAHQPHYQSRDYNILNGDLERWFEPVLDPVVEHKVTRDLIGTCTRIFDQVSSVSKRSSPWHTEMHQFRIEANNVEAGRPTPEGMHRDGVDWVCVVLVKRQNIKSGVTEIYDNTSQSQDAFTLSDTLDTVFLDDKRVRHGVTAIEPFMPGTIGYRDVLVLTFRHENS
tara:strand:- start:2546 stop:3328 length:783 start_codon:yes stop_codon:yes gene_type:complete